MAESAICQWLRIHDGYETVAVAERDLEKYWEEPACISSVIRLKSPLYNTHIDVVRAQANVAALPVVAFWGTRVMTIITSTRLVVLYPRFTFAGAGVLNPHSTRSRKRAGAKKYRDRGFEVTVFPHNRTSCTDPNKYCPNYLRFTEDKQTLSVSWNSEPRSSYQPVTPSFSIFDFSTTPAFWRWGACRAPFRRMKWCIPLVNFRC